MLSLKSKCQFRSGKSACGLNTGSDNSFLEQGWELSDTVGLKMLGES